MADGSLADADDALSIEETASRYAPDDNLDTDQDDLNASDSEADSDTSSACTTDEEPCFSRQFPREVLDLIIDGLDPSVWPSRTDQWWSCTVALEDMALVSKFTRPRSQYHLFRDLCIPSFGHFEVLRDIFLMSPQLARHVRAVYIYAKPDPKCNPDVTRSSMDTLPYLFGMFHAIEELTILSFSKDRYEYSEGEDDDDGDDGEDEAKELEYRFMECLFDTSFPKLQRLTFRNCVLQSYNDLARILSRMPSLKDLRMSGFTWVDYTAYSPQYIPDRHELWAQSSYTLRRLKLCGDFALASLEYVALITGSIHQIERLDWYVDDSYEHEFLCALLAKEKGLKHLTLTMDPEWDDWEYEDYRTHSGGGVLEVLQLKQRKSLRDHQSPNGIWANRFLDAITAERIEKVVLVINYKENEVPWSGLDWAEADALLSSSTRYPVLKQVMVCDDFVVPGLEHDDFHKAGVAEDPKDILDTLTADIWDRLPKLAERNLLRVGSSSEWDDWGIAK